MLFVFTGLGYLIWSATVSALNRIDDVMVKAQGGTTSLQELSGIVGSKMFRCKARKKPNRETYNPIP